MIIFLINGKTELSSIIVKYCVSNYILNYENKMINLFKNGNISRLHTLYLVTSVDLFEGINNCMRSCYQIIFIQNNVCQEKVK